MKKIAIFASGGGSNALKIIEHFANNDEVEVALIVSNKSKAGVLEKAKNHNIPTLIINRTSFRETEDVLTELQNRGIDFIALAGFLWLIPTYLVNAFPNRIVNIHPALLPKYGGKGMYGMNVHRAVHAAKEPFSGMTIHGGMMRLITKVQHVKPKKWTQKICCLFFTLRVLRASQKALFILVVAIWFTQHFHLKMFFSMKKAMFIGVRLISVG